MSDFTLFLGKFLRQGTAIASLAPSSPWLSRMTVRQHRLGAGTGASSSSAREPGPITRVLAERPRRAAGWWSWNATPISPACSASGSATGTASTWSRATFATWPASSADRGIAQADYIVSGLPVPSFPRDLQQTLCSGSWARCSNPRGPSTRSPSCPWVYWRFYRKYFRRGPVRLRAPQLPAGRCLLLPGGQTDRLSRDDVQAIRPIPSRPSPDPARTNPARPARRLGPGALLVNAGFHLHRGFASGAIVALEPARTQERVFGSLFARRRDTRFGRDHGFERIRTVADFQTAVPLRTYEDALERLSSGRYPVFENLTWPGRIPFLALTSGTTQGATKYIPVSREMVASNRKAAQTMVAYHLAARPRRGSSTAGCSSWAARPTLEEPAPGVRQGDLSGIAAIELSPLPAPLHVPAAGAGPRIELGSQAGLAGRAEPARADHAGQRRAELAAHALSARCWKSRQATIGEVWPELEIVVHGGVKFDPYQRAFRQILGSDHIRLQETYPCSEGFIAFGDPRPGSCGCCWITASFTSSCPSTSWIRPLRRATGWEPS